MVATELWIRLKCFDRYPSERKQRLDDNLFGTDLAERNNNSHGALIDTKLAADCFKKMVQ